MKERNRTTLCYIEREDEWLFIHKTRENDPNQGLYLGVGGHIEEGETPEQCIRREIREETTLDTERELKNLCQTGIIKFVSDKYGTEYMYVYKAGLNTSRELCPGNCSEGKLLWIKKNQVKDLPIWEGDKLMFDKLLSNSRFFLYLEYEGNRLVTARDLKEDECF